LRDEVVIENVKLAEDAVGLSNHVLDQSGYRENTGKLMDADKANVEQEFYEDTVGVNVSEEDKVIGKADCEELIKV
jgi:hypothetical protein